MACVLFAVSVVVVVVVVVVVIFIYVRESLEIWRAQ
jgi:hypothetical protein